MVSVWDWSARYCMEYRRVRPSFLDLSSTWLSGFGLISDGWLGLYISFGDWMLKVSVLETGRYTRYCSISESDPLRQLVFVTGAVVKHNNQQHKF